jgi:hypothetical protein
MSPIFYRPQSRGAGGSPATILTAWRGKYDIVGLAGVKRRTPRQRHRAYQALVGHRQNTVFNLSDKVFSSWR